MRRADIPLHIWHVNFLRKPLSHGKITWAERKIFLQKINACLDSGISRTKINCVIFTKLFLSLFSYSAWKLVNCHLTKYLIKIFFFQKKTNTNGDLAKVNNESNGAKVTVVVDYEPQKNSSQSHTLRQSDNVKILWKVPDEKATYTSHRKKAHLMLCISHNICTRKIVLQIQYL